MPGFPTINVDAKISGNTGDLMSDDKGSSYHINWWGHRESIFLSNMRWTNFHFNIGAANEYFGLTDWLSNDVNVRTKDELAAISKNYLSAYADERVYTLDDLYYPTKGTDFMLRYDCVFACPGVKDFKMRHIATLNLKHVFPIGGRFAFITNLDGRAIFNNPDESFVHDNYIGGAMAGRFISQRLPFFAVDGIYRAGDYLASFTAEARVNIFKNGYVSAMGGLFNSGDTASEFVSKGVDAYGAGAELAYNSIVGPIKINFHWSDKTGFGTYLSFGYDF